MGGFYSGEANLLCPVCGNDYVHPVGVLVEPVLGREVVYVNSDGVRIVESRAAERSRGIEISTIFVCEAGHQWEETRHFHKGITLHEVTHTTTHSGESSPGTIWRD